MKRATISPTPSATAPLVAAALAFGLAGATHAQDAPETPFDGFVERPDGARIHYTVHGEGDPVMLIHGYPLNEGLFRDNVDAIVEAGYSVVTPTLRGFGQSEAPTDSASIDTYSDDMLALMDELQIADGNAIALGMSMGGWTLFDMVDKAPERFRALAFNDTAAVPAPIAEAALWNGLAEQVREEGVNQAYADFLIKDMFTGATRANDADLVEYIGGLMQEASVEGAAGGAVALAERPDLTGVLGKIEVPTLFLFGIEDTLTPASLATKMGEQVEGSTVEIVDGASHALVLEAPEKANEAIVNWLGTID